MQFTSVFAGLLAATLASTTYAAPATNVTVTARGAGGAAADIIGDVASVVGSIIEGIEQDKIVSSLHLVCG